MRINIFFLIVISISTCTLFVKAQSTKQGIYLSADDFSNRKISFPEVEGRKYQLKLNDVFYKPFIKIIIGDSVFTFCKDSVYGYQDNENVTYRFFQKKIYTIINPEENILLYKKTFSGGYKNSQTLVSYFFSSNANSPLLLLTKMNLKNAFQGNESLHEMLDIYFKTDDELISYDSFYKIYKLNRVFQLSQKIAIKN